MPFLTSARAGACVLTIAAGCGAVPVVAQTPNAAVPVQTPSSSAPRQTGTVKEVHLHDFLLTTATGEFAVNVPEGSKILVVTPDVKKLSDAPTGGMKDIQPGDRASVTGTPGDAAPSLTATRVLVMKSATVSAVQAASSAAWAQGVGGIVKSVSGSTVTISSGMKTISVQTTASTVVRRYAPGSVNFADATGSTLGAITPGDQLRARGAKTEDGTGITADEVVSGNFKNYSGTIASIDPASSTITLKDLTTKKSVTVALTTSSDVRRLPAAMATMVAARMRGGETGAAAGAPAGAPSGAQGGGEQSARRGAVGEAGGQTGRSGGGNPGGPGSAGGGYAGAGGPGGGRGAGADLSRMLSRLPTETLGGLKQGEAVMIVATAGSSEGEKATAITLLVGVDAILAAPAGQSTTLSPWSLGGGGEGEMGGGGGQ